MSKSLIEWLRQGQANVPGVFQGRGGASLSPPGRFQNLTGNHRRVCCRLGACLRGHRHSALAKFCHFGTGTPRLSSLLVFVLRTLELEDFKLKLHIQMMASYLQCVQILWEWPRCYFKWRLAGPDLLLVGNISHLRGHGQHLNLLQSPQTRRLPLPKVPHENLDAVHAFPPHTGKLPCSSANPATYQCSQQGFRNRLRSAVRWASWNDADAQVPFPGGLLQLVWGIVRAPGDPSAQSGLRTPSLWALSSHPDCSKQVSHMSLAPTPLHKPKGASTPVPSRLLAQPQI